MSAPEVVRLLKRNHLMIENGNIEEGEMLR
jgi:hypothetical protein